MSATRKAIRTQEPMHLGAVATALKAAERTRGWNARLCDVHCFDLGNCVLIVVPARRWIYRRHERQA